MGIKLRRAIFSILCIAAFLSQTGYAYSVQSPSALKNVDIEMLAAQPKYDGREHGIVTPVRLLQPIIMEVCLMRRKAISSQTSQKQHLCMKSIALHRRQLMSFAQV